MTKVVAASDPSRVPEPGELVQVRNRQWIVSDVVPYCSESAGGRHSDLVTLESIDEDAGGEQISVIWQIEPGAEIKERSGLPAVTGYDRNVHLDAFLNAVRWGIATNVDRNSLLSPFRSGVAVEDYQLDPLVRAIDMARVNLLIADDTGLGKTIEAGLVVQELLIRHRARSVLIVTPASSMTNWQREMREKFGLNFRIIDSEFLHEFRRTRTIQANPWTAFPYLIASMDWIKQGEGFRLLKDVLPPEITYPRKFDILIVDEAHNVAPSGSGKYAKASLRTKAIQRLAPHFTHHLFLSATPHNGYTESFTSLLELLDNQRFSRTVPPSESLLQQVMVRRLKRDIVDKDGKQVFARRELLPLEIDYTEEEKSIHRLLKQFIDSRLESCKDASDRFGTSFVMTLLKKRLFSSPAAFNKTLEKYREAIAQGRRRAPDKYDERTLRDAIHRAQEEAADEAEVQEAEVEAMEKNAALATPLSAEEQRMLDELSAWGIKNSSCEDSKAKAILQWLDSHLKTDGHFNDQRVILFTEFMDTHSWLKTILAQNGYGGDTLLQLHGSQNRDERDAVIAAFQTKPGPESPGRILLATDSASESINLHQYCHYMIHVEIPWSPTVMDQRNGRIDRYGQKSPVVSIWHPVGKGFDIAASKDVNPGDLEGDGHFLLRVAQKVEAIRDDLGSVGGILYDQIQNAMLGKSRRLDADVQGERRKLAKKMLALEQDIKDRIAKLHDNLKRSREASNLTPDNVLRTVETALHLAGKPQLIPATLPGMPAGSVWTLPKFSDSWRDAATGLAHPHTGTIRPICFDGDLVRGRDDVVLAHLNHSLVRMSLRLLREEIWSTGRASKLHRVAIRSVAGIDQPLAVVWQRLLIVGGDHLRLHEELTHSGGEIRADRYRREDRVKYLADLIAKSRPVDEVPDTVFEQLKSRFEKYEDSIVKSYEARSKERQQQLEQTLEIRRKSEVKDIETVLNELASSIRTELGREGTFEQMLFDFSDEERKEVRRDFNALRARLEQIPKELESEVAAVTKHYSNPRSLTFPAAVLFLIPETKAWGIV